MAHALNLSDAAPHAPSDCGAHRTGTPHDLVLVVDNMHCGNCMRTVEQTLTILPDVEPARVNLSAKRVSIRVRDASATAEPRCAAMSAAQAEGVR